jgi:hypothetical protein
MQSGNELMLEGTIFYGVIIGGEEYRGMAIPAGTWPNYDGDCDETYLFKCPNTAKIHSATTCFFNTAIEKKKPAIIFKSPEAMHSFKAFINYKD